ncbi:hypothetical protein AA0472_2608 [Acetobacter estunensis NRIC 0472]|uniref:Uncharacterized protein n=1 Tax=Acetobacter estunensis TaxID=104097 RepID=A0A967B5V4_9PROT|nr:hypothetical protein [Acetobacter estunensis]NHO52766.1 hypothetical protein [Acetobacter estunensis]GBQ28197.1 hypothetical protein AA0472_2608 [Acetobacter estunensis NRIC 0472]
MPVTTSPLRRHEEAERSECARLVRWSRASARDTAIMLDASQLRRTNPTLVRAFEARLQGAAFPNEQD